MSIRIHLESFRRAENGSAMILWAISLVVVFGLVALAFDIGRLGATQSELQSFADNVALAAAGELDGKADARDRARAAAANLVSDTQTFANGDQALAGTMDYTLNFYASLPGDDTAPMTDVATDDAEAVYAEVVVTPHTVSMAFRAATNALLGGTGGGSATVGASAVAGYTQEACDLSPLMFCLPHPGYKAEENIGDMILLRSGRQGADSSGEKPFWGPGDFGFLDIERADLGATCADAGGNIERCMVAAELEITQCYSQRSVDVQPGQRVGIRDGMNVRFDIYKSPLREDDDRFPAAPNVISGLRPKGGGLCLGNKEEPNWLDEEAETRDTISLPHDDCFDLGACTRWGDGNWDYGRYIDTNHGDGNGTFDPGEDSHLTTFAVDPKYAGTRYATYLREIAYGAGGDILNGQGWETGRPQCAPAANISNNVERRVVIAAGIDCDANPISGAEPDVPVEEFFKLFLTEPVGDDGASPPTVDIWVEVIGSAGGDGYSSAGPGGIFRDVVQLYR